MNGRTLRTAPEAQGSDRGLMPLVRSEDACSPPQWKAESVNVEMNRLRPRRTDEQRRPLRVLITTDWWEPVVNGVVASVQTLRRELIALGCDVRTAESVEEALAAVPGPRVVAGSLYLVGAARALLKGESVWNFTTSRCS